MKCLTLEPMFSPDQVARSLGVEVETLGAWRRRGYGPGWYRIGKKIKYTESELRAWMNTQAHQESISPAARSPQFDAAAMGVG